MSNDGIKQEPDLAAFLEAVSTMGLGEGVDSAACHHSAVEIQDWHRIQKRLEEIAEREGDGEKTTPAA